MNEGKEEERRDGPWEGMTEDTLYTNNLMIFFN